MGGRTGIVKKKQAKKCVKWKKVKKIKKVKKAAKDRRMKKADVQHPYFCTFFNNGVCICRRREE